MTYYQAPLAGDKGFFGSLFDFNFRHFITLKFIKVIYALVVTVIAIGTLVVLVAGVSEGGANILIGVIVAPLVGLIYLVFTRITLEVIAVLFRIGENTSTIATFGTPPPPPAPVAVVPPPPPAPPAPTAAAPARTRKPRKATTSE